MNDGGECDPIIVADDDGEVLAEVSVPPGAQVDRSEDGSITSIVTPEDDWQIHVDENTEIGARIHRVAHECGETAEEFVLDAVHEFIEQRGESAREASDDC